MATTRLSQSALSAFSRCARRYYLRFVRRLEWPAPLTGSEQEWERSLRRGESFHLLIQQQALGMDVDRIVTAAQDDELARWWKSWRRWAPAPPAGRLFTELELEVAAAGCRLVARFDRLVVDDDGAIHIVDWKTGAASTAEVLQRSWQTAVYRYVALEAGAVLTGGVPAGRGEPDAESVRFTYWQTAAPEEPILLGYSVADHERARTRLETALQRIEALLPGGESAFPRTDDVTACRHCPYRSYCERGREAPVGLDFDVDEDAEADGWSTDGLSASTGTEDV